MTRGIVQRWFVFLLVSATLVPAYGLDPHRSLKEYGHQTWQTDNGLPENTVHSILQTRDGFLWIGTEGGLVRFDGVEFVTYNIENTPALKSNTIYDLLEDSSGALWISTADGLLRYQGAVFTRFAQSNGLLADAVWCTYQDRRGTLWAITADGVSAYRGGQFQSIPDSGSIDVLTRSAIAEDADASLWIATGSRVLRIQEQTLKADVSVPALEHAEASAVHLDRSGKLWIATRQSLEVFSRGHLTDRAFPGTGPKPEITALLRDEGDGMWVGTSAGLVHYGDGKPTLWRVSQGLPGNRIQTLARDRQGALWIGTDQGIARYFSGSMQSFKEKDGFSHNAILSIHEDREGDIWLGTDAGGLTILRDQMFTTYTTSDGLSGDVVRSILQDSAGTIWIGTNGSGLNRSTPDGFRAVTTANGLSSNVILAIASMPNGDLWIGTPDGLNRLHQGKIHTFTSADGLPDDFVRSLQAEADGSLWIGTRRGLSHWSNGRFINYSRLDGLGSDFIGAMTQSKNGDLWIGTSGGLTRYSHGTFVNYTMKDGLSSNVVTAMYEDAQGVLWLGTNGGGLNRLRQGKLQSLQNKPGGLPETIYGILEDNADHLWLSARTGIFRVAKSDLEPGVGASSIKVVNYGTADGMKNRECSSGGHPVAWKMNNGTLWFATLRGVSFIDPARASEKQISPMVAIENVLVDDHEVSPQGILQLQAGSHRLELRYAGLSFAAPQNVHYRYRLEGFDPEWIDAGTRRAAYYTNLPPGKYRFHVYAATKDGAWSGAAASIELWKHPQFYQTLWFYLVIGLGTVLVAYAIYRYRVHQVESRFRAVLQERGRIAREIHDTLAQDLVGVSVQLELVSRLMTSSAEAARNQLNAARTLVRKGIEDARTSIWDLRSQSSEDLPARLTKAVTSVASHSSAKVYVQVKGTYRPLEKNVEAELLRIGQEAVTNATRHAQATRIDVELVYDASHLRMSVIDDGRGFLSATSLNGLEGHFGIRGMRERAASIQANLKLESQPGTGTKVSVELPVA
ncbi:MAG TPA: two-component regulator propeller domain-containing protein [Acidisarcina sp.]|nr:two-component regulator propeller domain-containing protein [Acidisarcina sp.]